MTLGERLLKYRTDAKMSQDVLAEKIGVTRQTISKWETDQSAPEFNKILPLCELYGITTDELIKGETEIKDVEEGDETTKQELPYNQIRNKKRARTLSISIFLYIIATFSVPYMEVSLNYDEGFIVMIFGVLCAIATTLLIHFFTAYPKEYKTEQEKKISEENRKRKGIEASIFSIIMLTFLALYLSISFITMAWHITWILWIVWLITEAVAKLVFDLRRNKDEK